jgi:hypothetical protein
MPMETRRRDMFIAPAYSQPATRRWVVSTTLRPLYLRQRPGVLRTGGWVGFGAGLDDKVNLPPAWLKPRNVQPVASPLPTALSYHPSLSYTLLNIKVKLSRYRSGHALGVPGGWGSRTARQSANESDKFVSPRHRPSLPPGGVPGTYFC